MAYAPQDAPPSMSVVMKSIIFNTAYRKLTKRRHYISLWVWQNIIICGNYFINKTILLESIFFASGITFFLPISQNKINKTNKTIKTSRYEFMSPRKIIRKMAVAETEKVILMLKLSSSDSIIHNCL